MSCFATDKSQALDVAEDSGEAASAAGNHGDSVEAGRSSSLSLGCSKTGALRALPPAPDG